MILHIFPYEKFTYDYIERINRLFEKKEHLFWIYGNKELDEIKELQDENIIYESSLESDKIKSTLKKRINESDKVIVHSLFFGIFRLLFFVRLQKKNREKFFWNIWGADLYNEYWERKYSLKNRIREHIKKKFIKDLRAVGYIPGDYEFLLEHYKTNAKFYLASYTYDFFIPEVNLKEDDEIVNILLGNSATEECQYEQIIDLLTKYKNLPIRVICILSYPRSNVEYRKKIVEYGKDKLGEKFEPIVDFMSFEKYTELLARIDIAIFNHNRQQALGNIASLLYLGKRVYINPQNACKSYFENIGAKVFSIEDFGCEDICKIDTSEMKNNNRKAIDKFFSDEQFKERWRKIFDEKY